MFPPKTGIKARLSTETTSISDSTGGPSLCHKAERDKRQKFAKEEVKKKNDLYLHMTKLFTHKKILSNLETSVRIISEFNRVS